MNKIEIDITTVLPTFLATVAFLVNTNIKGRPLVAYNSDGSFLNFKVVSFKTALERNIIVTEGQELDRYLKAYMQVFRNLKLIITDGDRLTHKTWIDGKSTRSITVDKQIYDTLKTLRNRE